MPKALTIVGMAVAGILILLFGADLAAGFPFGQASKWMDIALMLSAGMLGYMSWNAFRDQA